jgi:hypothetical protein
VRVLFSSGGKTLKVLSRPNSGLRWVQRITPSALKFGAHRVLARVTFSTQSGTPVRILRMTFRRCHPLAT